MSLPNEAEYLARQAEARAKRDRAAEAFLSARLSSGPALVPGLKLEAKRRGVSWASVRLARYALGVQSVAIRDGQVWLIPEGAAVRDLH